MKFKSHEAGFSMVELLVVIAIISIVMAMVLPKAGNLIENGRENQCRNNLKQLHTAAMSSLHDDGENRFPAPASTEWWHTTQRKFHHRVGWVAAANSSLNYKNLEAMWPSVTSKSGELRDDLGTGPIAKFAVENGSIFKYMNNSFKHYVCPVMKTRKGGNNEVYRTYAMGQMKKGDRLNQGLNGSKLVLFTEVVPSNQNGNYTQRVSIPVTANQYGDRVPGIPSQPVGMKQSDSMLAPTSNNDNNEEYIAYDVYNTSQDTPDKDKYGIHPAPNKTKASLAVFMDGHIEKIYSLTQTRGYNMAWYLTEGKDPILEN